MFVVLQPHSESNSSDKYRLVDSRSWLRFLNGISTSYAYTPWNTYQEAEAAKDVANRSLMNP